MGASTYRGPVGDERAAIELHNTIYTSRGDAFDALAERRSAAAWLRGVGDRLPTGGAGPGPTAHELVALRDVVREVLRAAVENRVPRRAAVNALNRASARAPRSSRARWRKDLAPLPETHFHGARRNDVVIGSIAADAIDLITGPDRTQLRACGARGCVLIFLKDRSRREWCSSACGNRARQARHYRRTHSRSGDGTTARRAT
jgi:predicted RNA-binding Zn ribbon-like protein